MGEEPLTVITLLAMTDGRDDLLEKTLESSYTHLKGPISHRVIHTDNGLVHRSQLARRYPNFHVIGGRRLGFGGAINRAWSYILTRRNNYVFHLEDDFLFNRDIELGAMVSILHAEPNLHQLCLRRQPWNEQERQAGGIIEVWPDSYVDCRRNGHEWLEHRLFFSTNPSLYRKSLCERGWPIGPRSEASFSQNLFKDPKAVCGFWGSRHSGEWVHHIGLERVGKTY